MARARSVRSAPPAALRARLGRPVVALPATAVVQALLALLGWTMLAGSVCGTTDSWNGLLLAAWVLPSAGALAFASLALRARLLVSILGVAAGLALSFAVFLGVVFPLCG